MFHVALSPCLNTPCQKNKVLAALLRDTWRLTRKRPQLHILLVLGHTDDVENTIADRLADRGTQPALQHLWWRRAPLNGRWDEEELVKQIVSIPRETTPCDEALRVMWPGPVDFALHAIPSLGTATKVIETAAIECGAAERA